MKKVSVIGSGFSSLAAASYLAKYGFDVTVYEKNTHIGGRARQFKKDGFTFDMGPTWYWMPDVFESFFADFKAKPSDFYELKKLNPAYSVYFDVMDYVTIVDNLEDISKTFESIEPGSGKKLQLFIEEARDNYEIAIKDLVYNPGESIFELITPKTIGKLNQFVGTVAKDVRKIFKNKRLQSILEFPVLFLGAKSTNTPSFYNFMNYADFGLGTWHPKGGMYEVIIGMETLSKSLGVNFVTSANVTKISVENNTANGIYVNDNFIASDLVLSGADYAHTEQLLPKNNRQYTDKYWEKKTFAPSSLLFYVAFDKPIENVEHHTLFFDTDFEAHAKSIYDTPEWPKKPLFYASFPSKTDETIAPKGKEAATFLIPLAPGIEDSDEIREIYFDKIIERLEYLTKQEVKSHIIFKESYGIDNFIEDYNSYKGNAYGLANTLFQTAFLRPKLKSKKVNGLYFTGQLTVPGPGVPPSLISGKLTADLINKYETNL
jgi:phytoene desaturase